MIGRALIALALLAPAATGAVAIERADLVKAAVIEKIARFIEWPGEAPPRFALCVTPDHPQLAAIKAYYEGVTINDRPVEIQTLKKADAVAGCQVLFLAPRDMGDLAKVRANAQKDHVLLVAEGSEAARSGAHVGFYFDMNRPRIDVNRKTLEASGLKASFRLLEMAKLVD